MAQELAALRGQSVPDVVEIALSQLLEREKRKGMAERLMEIGRRAAPLWTEAEKSLDHSDMLYDELGLPK